MRAVASAGLAGAVGALVTRGAVTIDVGRGRRRQSLGPLARHIAAPPDVVFDVVSSPYLGRAPRAMAAKLKVLERGSDIVLAEHYTSTSLGVTTTLETVKFDPPHEVTFRLVRGPVPGVRERFVLTGAGDGTDFFYEGELETDFWALGTWWGGRVASVWVRTVEGSLETISAEAERIAARRR